MNHACKLNVLMAHLSEKQQRHVMDTLDTRCGPNCSVPAPKTQK